MQSTTYSQKPSTKEKLSEIWVLAIFKKLQANYLHKFTSAIQGIEKEVMVEWSETLAGLTAEEIKNGLNQLGSGWPPTSYEFRDLCKSSTDDEREILKMERQNKPSFLIESDELKAKRKVSAEKAVAEIRKMI